MANSALETEVVVLGGGIAGITTGLELIDHDHNVLILDRNIEDRFGGLARWSFGGEISGHLYARGALLPP